MFVASLCLLRPRPLPSVIVGPGSACGRLLLLTLLTLTLQFCGFGALGEQPFAIAFCWKLLEATRTKSSEGPELFRRIEGSSVTSSITTLISSISLNCPVPVFGPAEHWEDGGLLLELDRERDRELPRSTKIFTRRSERMRKRQAAMLIVMYSHSLSVFPVGRI